LTNYRKCIHAMNWTFINGLFYWLSNGEVPIDVRRTIPTDNEIKLTLSGMSHTKTFFVWIMPSVLALFGFQLLARRRKQ
jgi:ABC-2 type transport system permease protein